MRDDAKLSSFKAYLVPVIIMVVMGLVLFLPAGSLKYWEAWIWWSIISAMTLFIAAYFLKRNPELLSRRMKVKEKEPQPAIIRFLSFLSLFAFLVPGFDYRYHWSAVPVWIVILANALVFLGYLFIFLVFKENSYASTVIQVEKEQPVITTGPYAVVRHPMYTGLLIIQLFTPLALGSYWALIFSLLFVPMIMFRIKKEEEELLLRDLPGYADYANTIRYRLVPYVW
ncbi:methyltransferase [Syntrophothermus lipocalidus]|uniref:Isoprenylcysteine carboxyl methyltransferase n=1 Tax=Syntrophothermus lipocalidus (strain DSM 12680 / TGB-C1) TaxID=643648 RepID=D7CN15_SYNLT|nr:methyltransferase [Syntrophothermus lipocalidus]ADI02100.1 Isoprenylcysteine carboxyl methyltransferase [Syntrophothermus lipocalidus DSM 12680]